MTLINDQKKKQLAAPRRVNNLAVTYSGGGAPPHAIMSLSRRVCLCVRQSNINNNICCCTKEAPFFCSCVCATKKEKKNSTFYRQLPIEESKIRSLGHQFFLLSFFLFDSETVVADNPAGGGSSFSSKCELCTVRKY